MSHFSLPDAGASVKVTTDRAPLGCGANGRHDPDPALLQAHERVTSASVAELADLLLTISNDWPRTEQTLIARLAAARLAGLAMGVAA
jgi:hypothetical protein